MSPPQSATVLRTVPHRLAEEVFAIVLATLIAALGINLNTQATLLTGSAAGIALLLQYATGIRFGVFFALINVPFIWFSLARLGPMATLRTVSAVALVSVLTVLIPHWISFGRVEPLYAAILGGALTGVGLLILFRHRTALGGINVLALVLQEKLGIRAGVLMLSLDALIMGCACMVALDKVAYSALGTAVANVIIAINHRTDRYVGLS